MKSLILTTISFILIFASCNTDRSKRLGSSDLPYRIDVEKNISNLKSVPLSSIGTKLEYISLETKPESLLARALKIEMTDSLIFVSDGVKIIEFDKTGRYIRKIGAQGRGPGEYLDLCDFCVEGSTRRIYILDEMALLVFDFNGQLIESTRLPFLSLHFVLKDPGNLIYYSTNIPGPATDSVFSWYVTDVHGKNLVKFENYHKRFNKNIPIGTSPLYTFNGAVHFIEFGSDTLMFLRKSKPEPYLIFNFGNVKMDPDPNILSANREEAIKQLNLKLWPVVIIEDKSNIFVNYVWGFSSKMTMSFFNKKTLETIFPENNGFVNDLDGALPFWPRYIDTNNNLVDQADAFNLIKRINEIKSVNPGKAAKISEQLELLSKQLTENSNPVLIVLKR
jgi:hypothetical protein